MISIIKDYEHKTKMKYSNSNPIGPGHWNAVSYRGNWINFYSDADFIYEYFTRQIIEKFKHKNRLTIVDFGGGDGILLHTIKQQLEENNFKVIAINLDLNKDNLKLCKKKYPEVIAKKWDILRQYKKDFADIIVSRFVLQYQNTPGQLELIKNANFSLKKSGLFLLMWVGNKNGKKFNAIMAKITGIIMNIAYRKALQTRNFPSKYSTKKLMASAGFKKITAVKVDARGFLSANAWAERFNLNNKESNELKKKFYSYSKSNNLMTTIDGKLGYEFYIPFIAAEK